MYVNFCCEFIFTLRPIDKVLAGKMKFHQYNESSLALLHLHLGGENHFYSFIDILLLFGSNIFAPKCMYEVHLPPLHCKHSGDASSEILVRLKGVHFFGLIFIAYLGDLGK